VTPDDKEEKWRTATLLHATLHLPPPSTLTALFLRRLSPSTQLSLALCSTQAPPTPNSAPQASLLTQISHDTGKYSSEFLFSTDNALFGFKGLWNFGADPRKVKSEGVETSSVTVPQSLQSLSLLSAGGEAYYSPVSSVVGMSTGLRFTTLPAVSESPHATSGSQQSPSHISTFPYTLTLTLTPLTGSLSTTYSLLASPNVAFSSRFGFNVYSWESEMVAGCEVWRRKRSIPVSPATGDLAWARRKMGLHSSAESLPVSPSPLTKGASFPDVKSNITPTNTSQASEHSHSVVKIRVDQSWNIRVLWEGRVKELLVSAGVGLGTSSRSTLSSPSHSASGGGGGSYGWTGVGVSVLYSS
jgi:distribution and morphology protein 10